MLQPGQAVPVWFSALSMLVRGVAVPAVALQAKGNVVPLGFAQRKSERGPSSGCRAPAACEFQAGGEEGGRLLCRVNLSPPRR